MELFSLLAKLTLDTSQYDSKLDSAKSAGSGFNGPEGVTLDIDTSGFESALSDAEASAAGFTGPKEQKLNLDPSDFTDDLSTSQESADAFSGPDEQDLELDPSDFNADLSAAETSADEFEGPDEQDLSLDTSDFDTDLESAQTAADGFSGPDEQDLELDTSDFDTDLESAQTAADGFTGPDSPSLDLDTTDFDASIGGAEASGEGLETTLSGVWEKIKTGIVTAGVVAAIGTVKDAIQETINVAAKMGDDVDKGSRRLGISTKSYQEWGHALSQSGANINDFSRGILTMNNLLAGNEISKDATAAFETLGLKTHDANGQIKTTEQFLQETVKALASFQGTKAERGALVQAIFGRSGNNLNALFDSGAAGIQDLIDEANELGLVMTDKEIGESVAYGDALANFQESVTALKTALLGESGLLPAITTVLTEATKLVAIFNPRSDDSGLENQLSGIDDGLSDTAKDAEATARTATGLLGKLWEMGDATKLTADQQALWHETAKALVELIPDLSGYVDLDTLSLKGNKEELQGIIDKWEELTTARALQSAVEGRQKALAEASAKAVDAQVEATKAEIEAENGRAAAIEAVNKLIAEQDPEVLEKMNLGPLADDASVDEIKSTFDKLSNLYPVNTYNENYTAGLTAVGELTGAAEAAESARAEADKLTEEVKTAKEETDAWMTAMKETYFGTEEEAEQAAADLAAVNEELEALQNQSAVTITVDSKLQSGFPNPKHNAKGNWRVPYDDFPAILHRDEAVLTASEARRYRDGDTSGAGIDTKSLQLAVVAAIREGMAGATVEAYMDGKRVTQQVNRANQADLISRRYAP